MANITIQPETGHLNMGPSGFVIYARDFLSAFRSYTPDKPFSPAKYYLICRSIELSLKSYLLLQNVPMKTVKNKLIHNLVKITNKATISASYINTLK